MGAKAADRALTPALMSILALLTVVLVGFAATAQYKVSAVIALFLMGAFGFANAGTSDAHRELRRRGRTPPYRANIAAFNVGNALGAWLG